jgi:hypothetical protein
MGAVGTSNSEDELPSMTDAPMNPNDPLAAGAPDVDEQTTNLKQQIQEQERRLQFDRFTNDDA